MSLSSSRSSQRVIGLQHVSNDKDDPDLRKDQLDIEVKFSTTVTVLDHRFLTAQQRYILDFLQGTSRGMERNVRQPRCLHILVLCQAGTKDFGRFSCDKAGNMHTLAHNG
jgi:hypothetical protein